MKLTYIPPLSLAIGLICFAPSMVFAEPEEEPAAIEVVVKNEHAEGGFETIKLEYVAYNLDRSMFVGYYQDNWHEMVTLHDAKTKKQLGSLSCDGGVPEHFRFSKDSKYLGAKCSVGWFVWKIPSFEEVLILDEELDFYESEKKDAEAKNPVPAQPQAR